MTREEIIAAIDEEISRLEKVRELLQAAGTGKFSGSIGRKAAVPSAKKRNLSPEARARIAAAQKRRWAKQKAASSNGKKS